MITEANAHSHFDVAIVGGGITGLSTAWYLQQQIAQSGRDLCYVLLEQSGRWGGKICTEYVEGNGDQPFVVETGPDSFLTAQKPWAVHLAHELGLGDRLLPTNDEKRQVFVLNRGRLASLPDGVMLIVPTKFTPFALSPLISPLGKLRMGLDLVIPAKRDGQDETLADFIRRRLGAEALDKIAEPLMSGIYNADPEDQSILATFPRFRTMEAQYGSLIRGMLAARSARLRRSPAAGGNGGRPAVPMPRSMFASFQDGLQELVHALEAQVTGDLRLNTAVKALQRNPDGAYELVLDNGHRLVADSVVLTIPAFAAARLVPNLAPQAAQILAGMRYVSTATISLAFRRDQIGDPPDGFGVVIPRSERRPINALTWTSTKFDCRAPADSVLLRVFTGGSRNPQMMERTDEEIVAIVRRELRSILDIHADPIFHRLYRWTDAQPQYDVGHLDRVATIESSLPPGLFVTGSAYRGVGLPDCIRQAQETAQAVRATLAASLPESVA